MKKHMLPILLACQLIVSLAMTGFAATNQVTFDIGSISPTGYLLDDDTSRVDFSDSADVTRVRYGETVYYPLINNGVAAAATEEQLASRAMALVGELAQAQTFTASLQEKYEISELELRNAVNAAVLSGDQIRVSVQELLAAIENETPDGIAARADRIAELKKELDWQKIILDSAIALDSAAIQALSDAQKQQALTNRELETLRALIPSVERRENQHEALSELTEDALDSAHDALDQAEREMSDPSLTTAFLTQQLKNANQEHKDVTTKIEGILDGILTDLVTPDNFESVYLPYREAQDAYRVRLGAGAIDSGVSYYLSDDDPDEDLYVSEVIDYGDAIKNLLFTYRGDLIYSRESVYQARDLAADLERLGDGTGEPDQNGTLYQQRDYWNDQADELLIERDASRQRDAAQAVLTGLEEKQDKLEAEIVALNGEIAAKVDPLVSNSDELTPSTLEEMIEEWADQINDLEERCGKLEDDVIYYAAELLQEQQEHNSLTEQLSMLTDPDAPNALTRATRFRQGYPFLRFSQSFQDADSSQKLNDPALIDELEALRDLFAEDFADKGADSDPALLEALRPYESYQAAVSVYTPLLESNTELLRSASAARIALAQSAPDSVKYPYVFENKAVDGVKLKSKWEDGKSFVDSVSLLKKRYQNDSGYQGELPSQYIYFIALSLKDRDTNSASTNELYGTISMRKSSKSDSLHEFEYEDMELEVNLELGFNPPEDANFVPIKPATFYPDEDFDQNDEENFDFEADSNSFYVANTQNQKKLVLAMNTDDDEAISDLYADQTGNLSFWNGNGGAFNRSGYLYLAADEDSYVYRIDDQGDLVPINADYDHYENCFVIRTRILGRYVVSDVELDLINARVPDPEESVVIVIGPDDAPEEPAPKPPASSKPSTGWSEGSRSDEDEAPVSSSTPASAPPPETEVSSAAEELPATTEGGDISVALLVGASVAGALILTLIVFLIISAKRKKNRE